MSLFVSSWYILAQGNALSSAMHVVMRVTSTVIKIYGYSGSLTTYNITVNAKYFGLGYTVTDNPSMPSIWDSSAHLYLFASPLSTSIVQYPGVIYLFAVYPTVWLDRFLIMNIKLSSEQRLTDENILQNYEAKIEYSRPVVNSFKVLDKNMNHIIPDYPLKLGHRSRKWWNRQPHGRPSVLSRHHPIHRLLQNIQRSLG